MRKKSLISTIILFLLYIGSVIFLCLFDFSGTITDMPSYLLGIPTDKVAHFSMFLPFPFISWLLLYDIKFLDTKPWLRSILIICAGSLLAGIIEYSQELITDYRSTELLDMAANLLGITTGTFIVSLLHHKLKRLCDRFTK